MTATVRLGTVAGVRIGLHWSVLGILFIVTMTSVEENYARTSAVLGGLRARDKFRYEFGCADGRALVMDDGRLIGINSPSDVSRAAALRGIGIQSFDGADLARSQGPWR